MLYMRTTITIDDTLSSGRGKPLSFTKRPLLSGLVWKNWPILTEVLAGPTSGLRQFGQQASFTRLTSLVPPDARHTSIRSHWPWTHHPGHLPRSYGPVHRANGSYTFHTGLSGRRREFRYRQPRRSRADFAAPMQKPFSRSARTQSRTRCSQQRVQGAPATPNVSRRIRSAVTPSSSRIFTAASVNGGGPQRKNTRPSNSGTALRTNS